MKTKRLNKECLGCGDDFITFKNYDYCANCAVNNNRYLSKSNCSECDGSGLIKFPNQKPRPCKLCYLTKTMKNKPKLTAEQAEIKFWNQVDQQTHYLVADVLNKILPLPNLRDKKNLDLAKDADYRTIISDCQANSEEPEAEQLAEEIAYEYLLLVSKSLLANLSNFSCHSPEYFAHLTN